MDGKFTEQDSICIAEVARDMVIVEYKDTEAFKRMTLKVRHREWMR